MTSIYGLMASIAPLSWCPRWQSMVASNEITVQGPNLFIKLWKNQRWWAYGKLILVFVLFLSLFICHASWILLWTDMTFLNYC